ncbi:hypothetical protein N7G274_006220 [Stereocaulon virgatum]|uniref:Uncharacterized protein n=1 Tax=Stereocaulon virgatum TaxID=373712 RepID=A0ABR4A720_9LECA
MRKTSDANFSLFGKPFCLVLSVMGLTWYQKRLPLVLPLRLLLQDFGQSICCGAILKSRRSKKTDSLQFHDRLKVFAQECFQLLNLNVCHILDGHTRSTLPDSQVTFPSVSGFSTTSVCGDQVPSLLHLQ